MNRTSFLSLLLLAYLAITPLSAIGCGDGGETGSGGGTGGGGTGGGGGGGGSDSITDAGGITEDDAGGITEDDAGGITEDDAGGTTEDDGGVTLLPDAGTLTCEAEFITTFDASPTCSACICGNCEAEIEQCRESEQCFENIQCVQQALGVDGDCKDETDGTALALCIAFYCPMDDKPFLVLDCIKDSCTCL